MDRGVRRCKTNGIHSYIIGAPVMVLCETPTMDRLLTIRPVDCRHNLGRQAVIVQLFLLSCLFGKQRAIWTASRLIQICTAPHDAFLSANWYLCINLKYYLVFHFPSAKCAAQNSIKIVFLLTRSIKLFLHADDQVNYCK